LGRAGCFDWAPLPELLGAIHISRLASRDAAKSLLSTLVSESSGECRFD
jgi:hypothetical protein